jgi:hypothetical protein
MGDRGKKDKNKSQKQKIKKQEESARKKLENPTNRGPGQTKSVS